MTTELSFDFAELMALNKLLGRIKFESHLSPDEVQCFAMSPLIISTFKKIHKAYMDAEVKRLEEQRSTSILPVPLIDPDKLFSLEGTGPIRDIKERLQQLGAEETGFIKRLDQDKKREYCSRLFAPFIPTELMAAEVLEVIEMIQNKHGS